MEVEPEKTRILRFSRFHPEHEAGGSAFWGLSSTGRKTERGYRESCAALPARNCKGRADGSRNGSRRIGTCRKRVLQGSEQSGCGDITIIMGSRVTLARCIASYRWAIECAFKWLNRRGGKRKSYTWEKFSAMLDLVKIAQAPHYGS